MFIEIQLNQANICCVQKISPHEHNSNNKLECDASNGNRYPRYPQVMATAISQ